MNDKAEAAALSMEGNFEAYTAIADPRDGGPVDIDAVIKMLQGREELAKNESICYIGSGNFAVLSTGGKRDGSFSITKIIEYENKHEGRAAWRVNLKYKNS